MKKTVLILGAHSDVAKKLILLYVEKEYKVIAASRSVNELTSFIHLHPALVGQVEVAYFDAVDFSTHLSFYQSLPCPPSIVVYAAGYLVSQDSASLDIQKMQQMLHVNFLGAVSILSIIVNDTQNTNLQKIVGLSSLSGVRGRKSNFLYGATKAAFSHYLEGLSQELSSRNIVVQVMILGYINTKINEGLNLNKFLIMQPEYVAKKILSAGNKFVVVPNFKWKIIYFILKILPRFLLSKLP